MRSGRGSRGLFRQLLAWLRSDDPRPLVIGASIGVIVYSVLVLWVVATSGDIGIRCVLGTKIEADVSEAYDWQPTRPERGDVLTRIGQFEIDRQDYTDVVQALRFLSTQPVGTKVEVEWEGKDGPAQAWAVVRERPLGTWIWSLIWFLQEMVIFAIGALVFWKRSRDDSARLFFWLCVVTVGAFMGGYHWSEIVIVRPLIFLFVPFAMFVPILSLHFYLVFPRSNPILLLHRRRVLAALYGVPLAYLAAIWLGMAWMTLVRNWKGAASDHPWLRIENAQVVVKSLGLGYVAFSVAIFALCIGCLIYSYRRARNRAERNQVQWILLATLLSSFFIAYLLSHAVRDTAYLGLDDAAWPMYVVSLLYTLAYAISITRYKLMQAEVLFNRGVRYVLVSLAMALVYSGVLVVGAFLIGYTLQANQTSREGLVVGATALVILVLSGLTRQRFQRAIDRRFYREKYKFDQAMHKMSRAVDRLVDRSSLGRRLLEAAAEVLGLEWGAIYLRDRPGESLTLMACLGPEPDQRRLDERGPLLRRLEASGTIRVPRSMALVTSDPATDAMIGLGGEVASALDADGELAGVLILGPKRSGVPYEDEEIAFLGALSSVASLALHSASIQQTLEGLNRELRDKVEKIAEQRRRILVLQDQLMDREEQAERGEEPEGDPGAFDRIKGSSEAVRRMIALGRKIAVSPSAVLVLGESGTGKELLAEAIHLASPRAEGPFVKVHCAALSQGLLESELFGHVKGAFTGADRDRVGRFQQADGGTLFLDEIGDINLEVQTKLLRVLQEMAFERVGSSQAIRADVRIIAATHQDLPALIRAGRFREDLYYRLNVLPLRTPSLRERREDVFELAVHFLGQYARRLGKPITHLDEEAIEALVAHDWPGNIRELENVIERAVVLSEGPAITRSDLPTEVPAKARPSRRLPFTAASEGSGNGRSTRRARPAPGWRGLDDEARSAVSDQDPEAEDFERHRLLDALAEARGNKSEAARYLGMPRSTLVSKLKKYGLMEAGNGPSAGSSLVV
ncbi:hypothetical protein BH23PLA1_BH23PLA1_34460 [soil metagenome]